MMSVAFVCFAGAMLELLNNRSGQTALAFSLHGRVGDMVIVIQQLFESTDNFTLTQAVVRFDINMCRQSRDVRAD
jgi:hypothetical protein